MKKIIVLFLATIFLVNIGCSGKKDDGMQAEARLFEITAHEPVVDGQIGEEEYPLMLDARKMKLYLTRKEGQIYFGLRAEDTGWVAIGFGSDVMNQARMILGYVDGQAGEITEHTGRGNRHNSADAGILLNSAISESAGTTILEGCIDASQVLSPGLEVLDLIIACSGKDSFTAYHSFRDSLSLRLP